VPGCFPIRIGLAEQPRCRWWQRCQGGDAVLENTALVLLKLKVEANNANAGFG
jgi:hypothetical protein